MYTGARIVLRNMQIKFCRWSLNMPIFWYLDKQPANHCMEPYCFSVTTLSLSSYVDKTFIRTSLPLYVPPIDTALTTKNDLANTFSKIICGFMIEMGQVCIFRTLEANLAALAAQVCLCFSSYTGSFLFWRRVISSKVLQSIQWLHMLMTKSLKQTSRSR